MVVRRTTVVASVLTVAVSLAACASSAGREGQAPTEIKVGVSAALTGTYADVGRWFLRGVELAAKRYEGQHFSDVEVVSLDNKGDPTQAAVVFNKLVDNEGVPVVFGGFTNLSEPVVPIAARTKTVYVNPLAPADSLGGKPYVFNTLPLASQEMEVAARWMYNVGQYRRLGLLTSSQHDGVSAGETVSKKFKELGGEVVEWQQHQGEQADFSTAISKLGAAEPDVIMIHNPFRDFARAVRAVRAAGLPQPIVGYRGVESPDLLEMCGGACDGVVYTIPYYDASSEQAKEVTAAYQQEYGEQASYYFGVMYDAAWVVLSAIDKALAAGAETISGEVLKDAMVGTPFETPFTGATELTDGGVPTGKPFFIKVIKDGEFEIQDRLEG
ncbi:MAG: ABC transporter substrate-binding protein [Micromonosporaceae bacterium]|nr:ABC transporter substrate-binding protein [Micromonosporaceae bacterium]